MPRWPDGHDVHVFSACLDTSAARREALSELLTAEERARAARFVCVRDRNHFVVGRGLLRTLLAGYLQRAPQDVIFGYGAYGKPALATQPDRGGLRFNVSHSHGLGLFAFADGQEVGVDVERIEPKGDLQRLADGFFSAREVQSLRQLPLELRPRAFFACWTRKEAFIKATGEGLSRTLDGFDVSVMPDEAAPELRIGGCPVDAEQWSLLDLRPAPGFAAALVTAGRAGRVSCGEWVTVDPAAELAPRIRVPGGEALEVR